VVLSANHLSHNQTKAQGEYLRFFLEVLNPASPGVFRGMYFESPDNRIRLSNN